MPKWVRYRTIVEEPDVGKAVDRFKSKYPRFGEAFEALKWVLARKGNDIATSSEAGGVVYRLYRQAGDPLANTPDIIVLFTCDDNEVMIVAVNAEKSPSEED